MAETKEKSADAETELAHTPGPWHLEDVQDHPDEVWGPDGIAVAFAFASRRPEQPANARLIAAAPEMLTGCKMALAILTELVNRGEIEPRPVTTEKLRAAIASATEAQP